MKILIRLDLSYKRKLLYVNLQSVHPVFTFYLRKRIILKYLFLLLIKTSLQK